MRLLFLPASRALCGGELLEGLALDAGDGFGFCCWSFGYTHVIAFGGVRDAHRCPLDGIHRVGVECTRATGGVIDAKHIW